MEPYFTIEDECEQNLLIAVEDYLKNQMINGERRIYFSGEFDSHQSDFERASNNLEIGVVATNETTALVLLFFIRIIIDHRQELLLETAISREKRVKTKNGYIMKTVYPVSGKEIKIKKIIKNLAWREKAYMQSFKLDEEFTVKLRYGNDTKIIIKDFAEIDVWTLPRVMSEINDYCD